MPRNEATHVDKTTVDAPIPLLEKGDYVRLKEPYKLSHHNCTGPLQNTLVGLVAQRAQERGDEEVAQLDPINIQSAIHHDAYADLFEMTHGTVVETVTEIETRPERATADVPRLTVARNVSLHLFNPETGVMFVQGHASEPGKPEFVDHHAHELVLIQKHDETWSEAHEIDVAEQYAQWGIEDVGIPPE